MHVATVLGARPQFIKAAVVSHAFQERGIAESILHTGQHFDANMSDVFFEELGIPAPRVNLGIGGGGHGQNTGRMLEALEQSLLELTPDWVLVYGDTDSTLAGALAAAKLHIPVAHVEAGLRSFNRRMPEEINRVLTDHVAEVLFAPTSAAVEHLRNEGISGAAVCVSGDVMYDAALIYGARAAARADTLSRLGLEAGAYVLATVHRAENTDSPERLWAILDGLAAVGRPVVLPIHPRTRQRILSGGRQPSPNVTVIDPVGYLDMVQLTRSAAVVATDSGGLQKEAFFHCVPCVTMRDETEWVELVHHGWNRLAPPTSAQFVAAQVAAALGTTGDDCAPYGSGDARYRIADRLIAGR